MSESKYDIEDEPDFYGELKEAAWNILQENPGSEFDEWRQTLLEQYPTEVVDALGVDPAEAYAAIADMWDSGEYEDPQTGECHTLMEWAEYFATDHSVELYDMLCEARKEIEHFKALSRLSSAGMNNLSSESQNAVRIEMCASTTMFANKKTNTKST